MTKDRTYSKAERRLLDLGLSEPSEIDLEAIAWDEGVKIQFQDLNGCEARLVGYEDRAIITIRKNTDDRRKRFSIAHELGHWNYHRGRSFECRADDLVEGYTSKPTEEREADEYAANLLMPAYMFKPLALKVKRPTFDGVKQISDLFNTSLTATAIRLVDMNVWPLVLICHSVKGRIWFRRSKDVPERWFPQKELNSDSIAFDRLFDGKDRIRSQKINADAWFDSREAERYEIIEDAIKISCGQILTLLWIEDDDMLKEQNRR
jgi:Zn-dependent peptidase ImmA (M78 family)